MNIDDNCNELYQKYSPIFEDVGLFFIDEVLPASVYKIMPFDSCELMLCYLKGIIFSDFRTFLSKDWWVLKRPISDRRAAAVIRNALLRRQQSRLNEVSLEKIYWVLDSLKSQPLYSLMTKPDELGIDVNNLSYQRAIMDYVHQYLIFKEVPNISLEEYLNIEDEMSSLATAQYVQEKGGFWDYDESIHLSQ